MSQATFDASEIDDAFVIRPGDRVILRFNRDLTAAQAQQIKDRFKEVTGLRDAIILSGCNQIVVYRDAVGQD
ncbi:MAG: hypothetical protein ACXVX9_12170 [Mycobacteriaceae bacterium]